MAHQLLYTVLQASSLPRLIHYFAEGKKNMEALLNIICTDYLAN